MKSALIAVIALTLLPAATAQEDACSEAEPCSWVVEITEGGLDAPGGALQGTAGDWYTFEFSNLDADGADHTVTSSMDGSSWVVGNIETVTTDAFQLTDEGTYTLTDDPTGDTLTFEVLLDDVVDAGEEPEGEHMDDDHEEEELRDVPGPALPLLIAGLALLVLRRR